MAVVINEFEAVAEAPAPRAREDAAGEEGQAAPKIEAYDIAPALRALTRQALRWWAH